MYKFKIRLSGIRSTELVNIKDYANHSIQLSVKTYLNNINTNEHSRHNMLDQSVTDKFILGNADRQ